MYVTVREAVEITGLSKVSIYSYIKQGVIRTAPESKKIRVNIEDVYKLREEKRKDAR